MRGGDVEAAAAVVPVLVSVCGGPASMATEHRRCPWALAPAPPPPRPRDPWCASIGGGVKLRPPPCDPPLTNSCVFFPHSGRGSLVPVGGLCGARRGTPATYPVTQCSLRRLVEGGQAGRQTDAWQAEGGLPHWRWQCLRLYWVLAQAHGMQYAPPQSQRRHAQGGEHSPSTSPITKWE